MNRALRFAAYIVAGIVIGLAVAYGAIQILSRTDWGRERVRGFALGWLDDRIAGDVRIGRLGGGGLLSGVVIHDFAIVDSLGRTFVLADSAEVSYAWRTLLGGDIVLDEATLYHPVINLEMLPGDTLWNFERLFPDTTPGTSTPSRSLVMFDQVRIIDGEVAVRRPWEPDDPPTVKDTARILLEDVERGRVTVMRFEIDDAVFDRFIWESPLEEGKMVEIDRFRGSGYVWREPVVVENLQGTLTWVDSIISFEVPRLELPSTRASAVGQVVIGEDENRYDVRIDGQQLAFQDLQWLYPELPAEGAGSMILRIQSQRPKGILFLAERARITMPGTQLAGTVGIVAGDTLYFTTVELRASPLDLDMIERLLPGGLPVEGLLIGTVEISGPLSSLETRGDVRLEQPGSDAPNAVRWAGTIDVRGERARGLRADLEGFDLAVLQGIRPSRALRGRVTGTIEATGDLAQGIDLVASLEHSEGVVAPTRIAGGGTVRVAEGRPEFDLDITSGTFSLESLGAWAPALADLRGEAEGPIRVTGSPDDVHVAARLRTAAGGLAFDGRVDRRGPVPRISGQGTATAFQLRALSDSLPDARVTGNVAFDLAGGGLADMIGPVRVDIDTAVIAGVGIERARFAGTLGDGIMAVDTLTAASAGVRLSAAGDFGVVAGRSGTLRVDVAGDRLQTLEPLLFEEVADPTQPRVGGRLTASATLAGGVSAFDLSARALLEDWHWNDESGERASLEVAGVALSTAGARLDARLAADSLRVLDRDVDSARVALGYAARTATLTATAHEAGDPLVRMAGVGWQRGADGTHVELTELALGSGDSAWVLRDTAAIRFGPVGADMEAFALGQVDGAGLVTAAGRLAWVRDAALQTPESLRPVDFRAELRQVPFHEFLRLLNSDADGRGLVDGTITVAGSARAPKLRADVSVADLTWDAVGVERLTAGFAYDSSLITARFEAFQQDRRVLFGEGNIPADLRFAPAGQRRLAETLHFGLQADSMPAALALGFLDGFRDIRGVIDGAIEATGTTREPALDGALLLRGGATWAATGVRYDDIIGTVQFIGDRVARVDVRAVALDPREDEPSGSAWVTGRLDFESFSDPEFDLTLQARRMLAARRRDMDLTATGDVHITGSYTQPRISGSIRVDGGTLYLDELYRQYLIVGLDDPSLILAVDTSLVAEQRMLPAPESPFLRNLVVTDATIVVGPGSWLRSREMNVEVAGELTVSLDRRTGDIALSGTLSAVRGTYRLDYPGFARIFDVRDGTVEFPGTPGVDPNLDITAAYTVRTRDSGTLDVLAVLSGTLQNPRVRLTSEGDLPISESDLASYLFFGAPTYELNVASNLRGGEDEGGLAESTVSTFGFGYVASTLQTLAQSLGVVDYIGLTAAERVEGSDRTGIGGLLAATEIELGRYIGPELFVAYTQRLNSPTYNPGVRLEWRLDPQYTTEFFWEDRFARVPSFGLEAAQQKKVVGFFLFREWGY